MASTELAPTWAFMQAPSLTAAKDAGALGVIRVWTNISNEAALHQDQPWGSPPAGVPALWVGSNAGQQLKALATGTAVSHPKTPGERHAG